MPKNNGSGFREKMILPFLGGLIAGSLLLAIIDKENRPVYLEFVDLVAIYSFAFIKSENKTEKSQKYDVLDDSKNSNNSIR